jgi:hypothetical protein
VVSPGLTDAQITHYHEHGFVILRQVFTTEETESIGSAIRNSVERTDVEVRKKVYPEPATTFHVDGRYLLEPGLSYMATHPLVVGGAEILLDSPVALSASVAYLKTPGAKGTSPDYEGSHPTAHQDYKTYQQAGSSVNWLFAIAPMVDLVDEIGPLSVSPASFKFTRKKRDGRVWRVERSRADAIAPMQDAKLRRGDLLFMNMLTWHHAGPNRTDRDRYGIYYKYRARNAPAASGPELYSEEAHRTIVYEGHSLLPHYGTELRSGRVLVEQSDEFLLLDEGDGWTLPGGSVATRDEGSGLSNCIGALQETCRAQLGLDLPWMSYIGDFATADGLCRVYAHQSSGGLDLAFTANRRFRWCRAEELEQLATQGELRGGYEAEAVRAVARSRLRSGDRRIRTSSGRPERKKQSAGASPRSLTGLPVRTPCRKIFSAINRGQFVEVRYGRSYG